jgi:hypothetical protein|tara:strand:- start:266 stop:739 length:474 start_codon:yes stop_codon:yes gene_type:complete
MAFLTVKALIGLIIGVVILLLLWQVWNIVFDLLPQRYTVDEESYDSYQIIAEAINKLGLNKKTGLPLKLKSDYSLFYLNPDQVNVLFDIKKQYAECTKKSCLCLCQDTECKKVECTLINKKFKESNKILSTGKNDVRILFIENKNNEIFIQLNKPKQ